MPKYKGISKKRNKWYYWIWYPDNKKLVWYGGFDTAEEAHQSRINHEQKVLQDRIPLRDTALKSFIIKYLKEYEFPNNRITTAQKNEGICRRHIVPRLGDKKLQSLKPIDIVEFQNYLVAHKSKSVAFNTMRTLRKILNKAVEWEFIPHNPIKGQLPPAPEGEHPIITLEKLFEMITNLKGRDKYIVALAGFTGMRISEIFALRWEDIDFKENTISIRRQYIQGRILETKTKSSKAVVPIWEKLSMMLKEWRLASGSPDWVFRGRGSNPQAPEGWRSDEWQRIRKQFDLPPDFRFHDLRHTFTSILLAGGASPGDVQKLLRHSNYQTTMNIYRHLIPGQLERNFDIFNKQDRKEIR